MTMGLVTFCIDGESDEVAEAIERIQRIVQEHCPDLRYSVTEDADDD